MLLIILKLFLLRVIVQIIVAEALIYIFARVGVPREVLSDCGSQFISDLINQVGRLLSFKQIKWTYQYVRDLRDRLEKYMNLHYNW